MPSAYPPGVPSLLVTNDFPPKVGGIQSYLWELWRRLPPGRPELNFRIATMLQQLSFHPGADTDTLLDEAARYSS